MRVVGGSVVGVDSVPVTVLVVGAMVCCVEFVTNADWDETNADWDEGIPTLVVVCAKTSSMIKTKRKSVKVS